MLMSTMDATLPANYEDMYMILQCIKTYYAACLVEIRKMVKSSTNNISYEVLIDGKKHFVKIIRDFRKHLLYQEDIIYHYISKTMCVPKIRTNTDGGLYTNLDRNSIIVVYEWLDIGVLEEENSDYTEIICDIIKQFFEFDIDVCLNAGLKRMYKKRIVASFAPKTISYIYFNDFFEDEIIKKVYQLNDFYIRNIDVMNSRIQGNENIGMIHGDLNSTNIVYANGKKYLIDLDSVRIGFGFEDIDIAALDLCIDGKKYNDFLEHVSQYWNDSPLQILCGQIKQLNYMLGEIEKNHAKPHEINTKYFADRILALSDMVNFFL